MNNFQAMEICDVGQSAAADNSSSSNALAANVLHSSAAPQSVSCVATQAKRQPRGSHVVSSPANCSPPTVVLKWVKAMFNDA